MKNILLVGAIVLVVTVFLVGASIYLGNQWTSNKTSFGSGAYALESCALGQADRGTSTPLLTFLQTSDTSSSTLTCYIGDAPLADLNIQLTSSSTATRLEQVRYFS